MHPARLIAEHELHRVGNWPGGRIKPPEWLLDRIAEQKLNGGYTRKRNPVCQNCFVRKSNSGNCNCDES